MKLRYTVYMDRRDVTKWVTALTVTQPRNCLYRQADIIFEGWSSLADDADWDVFGSYDPTSPRDEILLRTGKIPEDRERAITIRGGANPAIKIRIYDQVWQAQRRAPRETVVMVPRNGYVWDVVDGHRVLRENSVETAIRNHGGPIGRYRVWQRIDTMHDAVRELGDAAGINTRVLLPDYPMQPRVLDPTACYWDLMRDLVAPYAPEIWYERQNNTIVFVDPLAARYDVGRTIELPNQTIRNIRALPVMRRRVRRVIIQVPPCH